jgi:5-methylthioadenosine/S-adenosylhomocysteine deaminase
MPALRTLPQHQNVLYSPAVRVLLEGGTLVTADAQNTVVQCDLEIDSGIIAAMGPQRIGPPSSPMLQRIDARGCVITPGFVQAHVHLCQVMMRGMADDMPLLDWLKQRIWPLEAAHTAASLRASAELGLLEMMEAGTTTILDMGTVRHHDSVMDACVRSGIRAFSGKTMMDMGEGVPRGLRETTTDSLRQSDALLKTWHGSGNGRVQYAYAPRFILASTEKLFRGVAERSRSNGALLHSHAAEHPGERDAVRAIFGADDVDVLEKWGICGPRAVLAHGVQLTNKQAKRMARDGTRIVHCPSANLKLGSGIARTHDLLEAGVQMGLGADGAPCNNNLDPWQEMRHAALLAKVRTGITTMGAMRTFRLATTLGAQALGIGDITGSLELGKRADIAVVHADGAHVEPGGDVYSRIVYACQARDVKHVFVDGTQVVRDGEHVLLDRGQVIASARTEAQGLRRRANL